MRRSLPPDPVFVAELLTGRVACAIKIIVKGQAPVFVFGAGNDMGRSPSPIILWRILPLAYTPGGTGERQ